MEDNRRLNLADIFIKLILVILFVLFTVWLLSLSNKGLSNSLNVLTDNIFAENIDRMKEVGKGYFTTERLPQKVGDVETLSLKEMYEQHFILEVKDKNGASCSADKSYVSVEKLDNEYKMKIYLDCNGESNYVIAIMGCYDYCDSDICEAKTISKQIEYEYMLEGNGKWTDYGNWSEWSKTILTKTDYRDVESKVVAEAYSYDKEITNYDYKELNAECPSGYKPNGNICTKSVDESKEIAPVCASKYNGYSLVSRDGFTCKYNKPVTYTSNDLTCPAKDGYTVTRDGFDCTYSHKVIASKDYVYACNDTCAFRWVYTYKTESTEEKNTATCPSGYKKSGNTCVYVKNTTITGDDAICENGERTSSGCTVKSSKTLAAPLNYSCPVGYDKTTDGTKCSKVVVSTIKVDSMRNVTYYRFRVRQYVGTSTVYKWSTSKNDLSLINAGYKLTGRTR